MSNSWADVGEVWATGNPFRTWDITALTGEGYQVLAISDQTVSGFNIDESVSESLEISDGSDCPFINRWGECDPPVAGIWVPEDSAE